MADTQTHDPSGVATTEAPLRSGADAIAETLLKCGVEVVFGNSGGGVKTLTTALVSHGVRTMQGRTELASAWMAYGYNRVKRRAASACLFHCVGTLHASPVIYAARLDSTPLVLMSVGISSSLDVRDAMQDSRDIYPSLKPLSKYIRHLVTAEDAPLAVRQAVAEASTGRFGPSVLDLAYEVLDQPTSRRSEPLTLPARPGADQDAVVRTLELIAASDRPLIVAGAGVQLADAGAELLAFAESAGIPIVSTSWGGRGLVADEHPLFAGVLGSFGWECANDIAQRSDLWLAIGTSFSQMTTAAWTLGRPERLVHIDIESRELGKIVEPTLGIVGDARTVLRQLSAQVSVKGGARGIEPGRSAEIASGKARWMSYMDGISAEGGSPINQYFLIKAMSDELPPGAIVVGDSGGQAFMLYRAFRYRQPTPMATGSRYMSLGASLPVAIGAQLAAPDRVVVSYHGDGGFYYDLVELSVLAERGLKVIVIIDNNHCMLANRAGMQMMGFENPWTELPQTTDFVAAARAFGVDGERVTDPREIAPAIRRALDADKSYVIDVFTDPDTRIRRAIKDVIPIISDRTPYSLDKTNQHVTVSMKQTWPNG